MQKVKVVCAVAAVVALLYVCVRLGQAMPKVGGLPQSIANQLEGR